MPTSYHVRPIRVPPPGGRRELDHVIGQIASTPLDRRRPLWEMYFAEGLVGQRVAAIGKIHHALADGVASANLMALATDWPASGADTPGRYVTDPAPTTTELLSVAARDHLRQLVELPSAVRQGMTGIARLRRRARQRERHPQLARVLHPPKTFITHKVSPRRTFATATIPFADVKATAKELGVTITDLALATTAGALRELLLQYDGRADEPLIASVPVSIGTSSQRISGNALSTLLVSMPTHVDDPLERVRLTSVGTRRAKENQELLGSRTIATVTDYAPAAAVIAAFRFAAWCKAQNKVLNPHRVQRAGTTPAWPGRWRGGERVLFGRSGGSGRRAQHHRVELRRSAQHHRSRRRSHVGRAPPRDRRHDSFVRSDPLRGGPRHRHERARFGNAHSPRH